MKLTKTKSPSLVCSFMLIFSFLFVLSGKGQSIKFSETVVDFGRIAANAFPPKVIEFTNTSDQKLAILIVDKSPDAKVEFIPKFYEPGEKGSMAVQYEPRNNGDFEEVISVYTNLDETPTQITLKGTAISILECFPDPRNLLKRSVEVIDHQTKAPVANAEVVLVHNHNYKDPIEFKVDQEGKSVRELPIGMYHIDARAEGYEEFTEDRFVPRSMPTVILELNALKPAAITPEPPKTPDKPNEPSTEESIEHEPEVIITSNDLPENLYAANNLIFLLDVSTSMKSGKKFLLLQQSVNNLALILRPIDNVSIITYSSDASVLLSGVSGAEKENIINAVQNLHPYGITRGVKGLNKAYEIAEASYIKGGNNQIILMTDGEFSEKGISDSYYQDFLSQYAARGIKLSIVGFGVNEEAINRMELMSTAGEGSFILIEAGSLEKEVLVNEVKSKSFIGE